MTESIDEQLRQQEEEEEEGEEEQEQKLTVKQQKQTRGRLFATRPKDEDDFVDDMTPILWLHDDSAPKAPTRSHNGIDHNRKNSKKTKKNNNNVSRGFRMFIFLKYLVLLCFIVAVTFIVVAVVASGSISSLASSSSSSSSASSSSASSSMFHVDSTVLKDTHIGSNVNENADVSDKRRTIKELQIRNYVRGTALMYNIHVVHHAGTTFCNKFARPNGNVPEFACLSGNNWPKNLTTWPWDDRTDELVDETRRYFHMISTEHAPDRMDRRHLNLTHYEHPNLLTVAVMRHPLDRMLAGNAYISKHYPLESDRTVEDWWNFANEPRETNNYALRVFAENSPSDGPDCGRGKDNSPVCFERARDLLRRVTILLDQDCLTDSLVELAKLLGLQFERDHPRVHRSARERFGNDTLYDYIRERNKYDIQLYEWAKTRALVTCPSLDPSPLSPTLPEKAPDDARNGVK